MLFLKSLRAYASEKKALFSRETGLFVGGEVAWLSLLSIVSQYETIGPFSRGTLTWSQAITMQMKAG